MPDIQQDRTETGPENTPVISNRAAELGVALLTAVIGIGVMAGSYQVGITWSDTGPQSGYFPFYIGLIMLAASCGTIFFTLWRWSSSEGVFITRGPLRHVLAVFIPICVYVAAIRLLGMYLASVIFIAWFMAREGGEQRHGWLKTVLVSSGAVLAVYLIFERWFQVPLYAGPLVEWLGLKH
jgi:putative tricarboxylic transport membrane protein